MNLGEMEQELYEGLGEPSDLDPEVEEGYTRLDGWINRAYKRICSWRWPDGKIIRFPNLVREIAWKWPVLSGTADAGSTATTLVAPSIGFGAEVDEYRLWLAEITSGTGVGQTRLVTASDVSRTLTVVSPWDTTPDDTSVFSLYTRHGTFAAPNASQASENIPLDPSKIVAVTKITDLEDESDLIQGGRTQWFTSNASQKGTPTAWVRSGNDIVFDLFLDKSRWYRMEYLSIPETLVDNSDVPTIPEPWHDAILLQAMWLGLRRNQEWSGVNATWMDLEKLMGRIVQSDEMQFEREDANVEVL